MKKIVSLISYFIIISCATQAYSQQHNDTLFNDQGNLLYDDLLKEAKTVKKPLLLYFTGITCVNCRKMEGGILLEKEIFKRLASDFIFVPLYVDNRKELPKNEWFLDEATGRIEKTIGAKYMRWEREKFGTNYQPLFVIVDSKGKEIKKISYETDISTFLNFLKLEEK